jgi:hypothetical protein
MVSLGGVEEDGGENFAEPLARTSLSKAEANARADLTLRDYSHLPETGGMIRAESR